MVGESNQSVFLTQRGASSFAEFEISEFEISKFDCSNISFTVGGLSEPYTIQYRDIFTGRLLKPYHWYPPLIILIVKNNNDKITMIIINVDGIFGTCTQPVFNMVNNLHFIIHIYM